MTASTSPSRADLAGLVRKDRINLLEVAVWIVLLAAYFLFDRHLALGSLIIINILFAISLDLIVGYAGIVTLGHAVFFGVGAYTAGILAAHGYQEPLSGLAAAAAVAGLLGLASGAIILRTHGLTLVMLTLVVLLLVHELANHASWLTGGADGLYGIVVDPVLGLFRFDIFGRTAYLYALAVAFLGWLFARQLVRSPFGRSLEGIRENPLRMRAIGTPVHRRLVTIYALSAMLAGVAGGLLAQTTQSAALTMLDVERSGIILVMLIFGGVGRLTGAFVGVPLYMLLQDTFSRYDPVYWLFWVGLALLAVVLLSNGGILDIVDRLRRAGAGRR